MCSRNTFIRLMKRDAGARSCGELKEVVSDRGKWRRGATNKLTR